MSDHTTNHLTSIEPRPPSEEEEGCYACGDHVERGHAYCELCIDDMVKARRVSEQCAALVTDIMQASNRARAVDDAGPAADLGLQATEAA